MHTSDIDTDDTAHEYHADNPDFPAKTVVATLFIGAFFGYLNDTLLNVALTPIMKDFGVDKTTVQWLTTGFLLVMGELHPKSWTHPLQLTRCSFFMSKYTLHFKYQAVLYYLHIRSQQRTADHYGISRTHLRRWIRAYP